MMDAAEVNGTKGGDSKQAVLAAAELTNGQVIAKFAGANRFGAVRQAKLDVLADTSSCQYHPAASLVPRLHSHPPAPRQAQIELRQEIWEEPTPGCADQCPEADKHLASPKPPTGAMALCKQSTETVTPYLSILGKGVELILEAVKGLRRIDFSL